VALTGLYLAHMLEVVAVPPLRLYVRCFLDDILPSFGDITERANAHEQKVWEELCAQPAGEDFDGDMGGAAEEATDQGISFYQDMTAMRQGTLNLFTAGFYHLFEQRLAETWHDATIPAMGVEPPKTKLYAIADWMRLRVDYDLKASPHWGDLDILRMVANTVKHGAIEECERLRVLRPDYFMMPDVPEEFAYAGLPTRNPLAGENLYMSPQAFEALAQNAIASMEALVAHFYSNRDHGYPNVFREDIERLQRARAVRASAP
jgi:hypothetical protein